MLFKGLTKYFRKQTQVNPDHHKNIMRESGFLKIIDPQAPQKTYGFILPLNLLKDEETQIAVRAILDFHAIDFDDIEFDEDFSTLGPVIKIIYDPDNYEASIANMRRFNKLFPLEDMQSVHTALSENDFIPA